MEKLIIQLLFKDSKFRNASLPYLKPDMFQYAESRYIIGKTHSFIGEYGEFPKIKSFALSLQDQVNSQYFSDCFDTVKADDFNYDHLLHTTEDFIKRSLLANEMADIVENISDSSKPLDEIDGTPDSMRDILSFSFDNHIGIDLCSDEGLDGFFEFLTDVKTKIPTNLPTIDKMIGGGFFSKALSLFVGGTNTGKSATMCSCAADNILHGKKVLYVTLEMGEYMIGERILANIADVPLGQFASLQKEKFKDKILGIKNAMNSIIIKEYPPSSINSNTITKLLKDLEEKKGFVPDILYIDYIGLMKPNMMRKSGSKYEDLKTVSEEVRAIAVENDLPIVSVAQVNRGGMGTTVISLSDIAESFGVAMTADLVLSISQPDELKAMGRFIWTIIKHRFGVNYQSTHVEMNFPKMRVSGTDEPIKILDSVGEDLNMNGEVYEPDVPTLGPNADVSAVNAFAQQKPQAQPQKAAVNNTSDAVGIINNRMNGNNRDSIKKRTGFDFT